MLRIAFAAVVCWVSFPSGSVGAADDSTASTPYLLQMIRDDVVHQELRLDEAQKEQVYAAIGEVDPRWWVSRILPAEQQAIEIQQLTEILRNRLTTVLNTDQQLRLLQLERQAHGTRMMSRIDAIETLQITRLQTERLQKQFADTDAEVTRIQKQLSEGTLDAKQAASEITQTQQSERQSLMQILTDEQRNKIGAFVGSSFDFSAVRRTYPRAPEFVMDGSTWLGSDADGSPAMKDLRGKVVAVYFYAFQCINCQRNFPHYKAWHADLADEGLVVIGIQRPETSAEADINAVTAAMRQDGFQFPVLFDKASANWNAWGNTMWPTTYLIDKDGFIRRWWQGEMNWQGTPGEQQMRETIAGLLAE
jgi:peroxiredoxin